MASPPQLVELFSIAGTSRRLLSILADISTCVSFFPNTPQGLADGLGHFFCTPKYAVKLGIHRVFSVYRWTELHCLPEGMFLT